MKKFHLDHTQELHFESKNFKIIRKLALIEPNKLETFAYSDIQSVKYNPRNINFVKSIINFILMSISESVGNPVNGSNRTILITFFNGDKRHIDVELTKNRIIKQILLEFQQNIKL